MRSWPGTQSLLSMWFHEELVPEVTRRGLHAVFERIVYTRTLPEMIDDGYLVPLRGFRVATSADLTRLAPGGQDFREDELGEAVDIEERNALVARSIQELARDRRTIAFCVTVSHARNLCDDADGLSGNAPPVQTFTIAGAGLLAGIELAYKIALDNFKRDGNNRVILATDGDFNVGVSSPDALVKLSA